MRVLITRPIADAQPLAELLETGGVASMIDPLLDIQYLDGDEIELDNTQGLLVTSANGIRAFALRSQNRDIRAWTVGDASARATSELGFTHVKSASGDVETLAKLVINHADTADGALLHVAGTRLAGDLGGQLEAAGFIYNRVVLYEAKTSTALSPETCLALQEGTLDGVVLYSPKTAAIFRQLIEQQALQTVMKSLTVFCLSPAVAAKVSDLDWKQVAIASSVTENALVEDIFRAAQAT